MNNEILTQEEFKTQLYSVAAGHSLPIDRCLYSHAALLAENAKLRAGLKKIIEMNRQ